MTVVFFGRSLLHKVSSPIRKHPSNSDAETLQNLKSFKGSIIWRIHGVIQLITKMSASENRLSANKIYPKKEETNPSTITQNILKETNSRLDRQPLTISSYCDVTNEHFHMQPESIMLLAWPCLHCLSVTGAYAGSTGCFIPCLAVFFLFPCHVLEIN